MKLFEIPVYALSKSVLEKRVQQKTDEIKNTKFSQQTPEDHLNQLLDRVMFPQRLWEYNHIIGYIVITKRGQDINLDWYTVFPSLQRYHWDSRQKHYMQNMHVNGQHFFIGNLESGEQLKGKMYELVVNFAKTLKKNYYVDMEAFNNISSILNYDELLKFEGY